MVSFAFPLEGILASQINEFSCHQRAFSSKAGLHDRWSKLANGMPNKVREVERKQYGISFFLLSNQKCIPKVNRKKLGPKLFSWEFFSLHRPCTQSFHGLPESSPGESERGDSWFFREIVQCSQANRKVPWVLDGGLSSPCAVTGALCVGSEAKPEENWAPSLAFCITSAASPAGRFPQSWSGHNIDIVCVSVCMVCEYVWSLIRAHIPKWVLRACTWWDCSSV